MSALERIAELHTAQTRKAVDITPYVVGCAQCFKPWPCPTRRLCDEAAQHHADWGCDECVMAEMAARADADRLAAALRCSRRAYPCNCQQCNHAISALAAHDAARTKEGL